MKKLLLLSLITAATSYSVVSTKLDVNATLIKPLTITANTNSLFGSISKAGGKVTLSTVDLSVEGSSAAKVKVTAPKDITFTEKTPGKQTVVLQSKFSTTSTTVGTNLETDLVLSATGQIATTYHIEGNVPASITTTAGKTEFEATTDITVAYN